MTGADIITQAGREIQYTISNQDGLDIINYCLKKVLPKKLKLENTTSFTTAALAWNALPDDFIAAVEIRKSDGNLYTGDVEVRGNRIRFGDADTYSVDYIKVIPILSAISDTPLIPDMFHPLLVLYVQGRIMKSRLANTAGGNEKLAEFYSQLGSDVNERSNFRRDIPRRVRAAQWR